MKLGRLPRPSDAKALRLASYQRAVVPRAPDMWDGTFGATFNLYRNDEVSDCTIAAIANLASVQSAAEGRCVAYTDEQVVDYYFALTDGKDVGAVEVDVLGAVQSFGFPTSDAYRVRAWAAIEHDDLDQVKWAASHFIGAYLGAELPLTAQRDGLWDAIGGVGSEPGSWGGHAMTLVGYDASGVQLATWGRVQRATWAWWLTYVDEAYAIVDADRALISGLDFAGLLKDMESLRMPTRSKLSITSERPWAVCSSSTD